MHRGDASGCMNACGGADGFPARMIGIGVGLLILLIVIILVLSGIGSPPRRALPEGGGMNPSAVVRVTDPQGGHGTIDTTAWPLDGRRAEVLVRLEGGQQVLVPLELLVRQEDGSYRLTVDPAAWEHQRGAGADAREPPLVLPVIEETLTVDTRPVETGRIRIRKVVREREELVDPPLLREEVIVERVPVNRVVEGPVPVRYEGDTMILSCWRRCWSSTHASS